MRGQRIGFGAAVAAVVGACGGGGGGSTPDVQLGFEETTSAAPEGAAAQVAVALDLAVPVLLTDVTVTVRDLGTGTATSGVDYAPFPDQQITFTSGAVDADSLNVALTLLDDGSVEGADETIDLELTAQTKGKLIGAKVGHTLTILEGDQATIAFEQAGSVTPDESDTSYNVGVELSLDPGDQLDTNVTVEVADAGTGSATDGSDYVAFPTQTLTFTAGTPDGSVQNVSVSVMDDVEGEPDETVDLALSAPSIGAVIGTNGGHQLTITEDDVTNGMMSATADATQLTGNETLDFGAANLGTLGGSMALELENLGVTPLTVSLLTLTGDVADFKIEAAPSALPEPPDVGLFPLARPDVTDPGAVALAEVDHAWLAERQSVVLHGVPLPGGGETGVQLERLPSPWTEDAVVVVDGVRTDPEELCGGTTLWSGQVLGQPESSVFLAFSEHGSRGWIRMGADASTEVLLLADGRGADSQEPVPGRVVWSAAQVPAGGPPECGGALVPPGSAGAAAPESTVSPSGNMATVGITYAECRLAIETDYQYHQQFGGTQAATDYVQQLIAAISDVYERDVQTRLTIAYLGIHSNSNDGWTTPDGGGNTFDLLNEFQTAWSPGNGGMPAPADLAHFISGANLGGGVAYLDVLCSQSFGFGVSSGVDGDIDFATFDYAPSWLTWDFVVVAHELGHNFGSSHTHDYCPPIDLCAASQYFGSCQNSQACAQGTLMSYCHTCGGGMPNIRLEFHATVAERIRQSIASSCLGTNELPGGALADFTLRFAPTSGTGAKSADLEFTHAATNLPSPFTVTLNGQSQ